MGVTVTEIARESGVSVSLVSRLLRDDKNLRVSEQKRREILAVRDRLGGVYSSRVRRALAYNITAPINREFSVSWVEVNFANHILTRSFEDQLQTRKFRLSLTFFDESKRFETFKDLAESPSYCDGLFLLSNVVDKELADYLLQRQYPHVSMDIQAEVFGVNSVSSHFIGGLRQAVNHLKELGHRKIGYVGPRRTRYADFLAAMTNAELSVDERLNCEFPWPAFNELDSWTSEVWTRLAEAEFGKRLDQDLPATAVIVHNDMGAFGVIKAMRQRNLVPGRDISVIGFDNVEQRGTVPSADPILTTVDNPQDLVGRRCADLLLNQVLHQQHQIVHERIPVSLIVRKTTGPVKS